MTNAPRKGFSRRDFMRALPAPALLSGSAGLLQACSDDSEADAMTDFPRSAQKTESRTLHFDHSHILSDEHDYHLVAGKVRVALETATTNSLAALSAVNSLFGSIPSGRITHHARNVQMPADAVMLCHVRRIPKNEPAAPWELVGYFLHIPAASVLKAHLRRDFTKPTLKSALYGLSSMGATEAALLFERDLITPADSATAFVFHHPEITSMEPDSAAHIAHNVIGTQSSTTMLALSIQQEGAGWMTNAPPFVDPDTNQPYSDSNGRPICLSVPSDRTSRIGGAAVNQALQAVKQDVSLGANVSEVTDSTDLTGKIWAIQNGVTYTDATNSQAGLQSGSAIQYAMTDVSTGGGYQIDLQNYRQLDNGDVIVTLQVTNCYLRYLGIFIRYIDASGAPIPNSALASFFQEYDSTFYKGWPSGDAAIAALGTVAPEYALFGIPIMDKKVSFDVPMPRSAASFEIIANTIGHGHQEYSNLGLGVALTAAFNLATPSVFLLAGAGAAYARFANGSDPKLVLAGVQLFRTTVRAAEDAFNGGVSGGAVKVSAMFGEIILDAVVKGAVPYFVMQLTKEIASQQVIDSIPLIGQAFFAISAAGMVASITQTAAQAFNSPWNYVTRISLSHTASVTISHDPKNAEGFPSVATHFVVTLICRRTAMQNGVKVIIDSSSPIQLTQQMQSTTRTAPITVSIPRVPYGGDISVMVGFYSDSNWLAGHAELLGDNTQDSFALTLTQVEVPLLATTVYSHKEKTALDGSGNHVWIGTKVPPSSTVLGQCGLTAGQLCEIESLTYSNYAAALGYAWRAFGKQNTTSGQYYWLGGISTTGNPELGAFQSADGSVAPIRVVYDLMGSVADARNFYLDEDSGNYIRQIRLDVNGRPSLDGPNSNIAWGRLNMSSDALLLTSTGKIVSINQAAHKIEVLTLPTRPTSDADAVLASVYSGLGVRPGLMDTPLCAALTPKNEVLILETGNSRVQAFDTGGNPVKRFINGTSPYMPLRYPSNGSAGYKYLDMKVEYTGYIYLLSYLLTASGYNVYLDIYKPNGDFLSRTSNFSGVKIAVSYWRDVFAANLEVLKVNGAIPARTEPSVSRWIPSTP